MAATPQFKVYNPNGEYVAACKHPEDAAAIVALYGGGKIYSHGHSKRSLVYTDGVDGVAGESYDAVAAFIYAKQA